MIQCKTRYLCGIGMLGTERVVLWIRSLFAVFGRSTSFRKSEISGIEFGHVWFGCGRAAAVAK